MSKTNEFETDLLEYIFDDVAISYMTGSNLYVSLHTGDPGEAGNQSTNECAYTSYARVAVAKDTGWDVASGEANPAATISFPQATGGSETVTHFGVGTDATGNGHLLYFGTVTPNISVSSGVTPQLTTASSITED